MPKASSLILLLSGSILGVLRVFPALVHFVRCRASRNRADPMPPARAV